MNRPPVGDHHALGRRRDLGAVDGGSRGPGVGEGPVEGVEHSRRLSNSCFIRHSL